MNRRISSGLMMAIALLLSFALAGCGSDDSPTKPKSTTTTDAAATDKADALEAFARYWDEKVAIANAGKVPKNALETTAIGPVREQEIARLTKDAEDGMTRKGAPKFKNQAVTLQGEKAVVITCIDEGDWIFVPKDAPELAPKAGWGQLGRELTKVDGNWLVTGYVPSATKEMCE